MTDLSCAAAIPLELTPIDQTARTNAVFHVDDDQVFITRMPAAIHKLADGSRLAVVQHRDGKLAGGFTAFIPWAFQPDNTAIQRPPATAVSYLRLLALSRVVLNNFDNLQASWVTMGPRVAQLALFFGANDFGSTMIEENVVAAAGVQFRLSIAEIQRIIAAAGFRPQQRTMAYQWVGNADDQAI